MIPHQTFTLPNGLRVVHSQDPQSAMCAVVVLYDTGARDEDPALTGMAHLFEHLMFGGSPNAPSFDGILEMAGGMSNAATSNDFTIFYDYLPVQNVETALFLESDRMRALAFSDRALEVQRHVVIEEFKEVCLNRPYGKVSHALRPLLYEKHPYRWPVIGVAPEHIERVTQPDVKAWHAAHYAPNNAILCIIGNLSLQHVQEMAHRWFGPIPARQVPERKLCQDPWPTTERTEIIYDSVPQTAISIAYRMDPYGTKGYFAGDAISDILAAGKSARFYQRLVLGTDLFTSADASITGSEDSGYINLTARLSREGDQAIAQAKALLIAEAQQLAVPGNVSEYELERTKNRYESTFTMDNIALIWRAQNLAQAAYHGEDINLIVDRYRATTPHDIAATARRLFLAHAPAIVICRPTAWSAGFPACAE